MAAAWAYFDTSVIVKRYVKEDESPWAAALLRRHRILSSTLAPLEAASALYRRQGMGDLTRRDLAAACARMRRDRAYWTLVEASSEVLERAEALIGRGGVRTLDAIHLASALWFKEETKIQLAFVTADVRQGEAAKLAGLRVVSPGQPQSIGDGQEVAEDRT